MPYLPIDPKHVGRTYEAVIRVNSQSGKGGVAYIMKAEHGFDLPRRLQIEFSKTIQTITEDTGTEISPERAVGRVPRGVPARKRRSAAAAPRGHRRRRGARAHGAAAGRRRAPHGEGTGNGPIAAFVHALERSLGLEVDVVDYAEHALSAGHEASAAAYVELTDGHKAVRWGVGIDKSISSASLKAVVSAINHQRASSA